MLDKILEFGSYFDWVTPLIATIKDATNRPAHKFLIPADCGWSGLEIERLLRSHGVRTWGLMRIKGFVIISMRLSQACWAQYLLQRERIPIEYGLLDSRHAPPAREGAPSERSAPQRAFSPRGIWAELGRAVGGLADEIKDITRF